MDITQIFIQAINPLISEFWWIISLPVVIAFLKLPFMKGYFGELQVNLAANIFLNKNDYTLFKNVTLPTEDGTTQIDHIIVSRHGIFVIETKNVRGWIFGSPQQKTWTQKIYRHTSKFQNPLHQNYKHTQTLQSVLDIEQDKLFSLVVFVGNSEFKTAMPENIVYAGGYIRFIKSKTQPILSDRDVLKICSTIKSGRLRPSIKTHINHVQHVKAVIEEKQRKDANSCPKCGKPMILRTAQRGTNEGNQFWGCSGFPICKTVKQIT